MPQNILHIFTDQMRFDAIGAHGNLHVKTPNIDRLIASGITFTNAYTPSPVCVAARCSMLYGQYPLHTNCFANGNMPTDGRESFVGALTRSGYRTHGIGKCHFTPDIYAMRGFQSREQQEERSAGDITREPYYSHMTKPEYSYAIEPNGVRGEMYYIPQPSKLPAEMHPTQWIGDRSIAFIEQHKNTAPWYLFSSFIHPHPPFSPPSPWHRLYRSPDMPLPHVPADSESLLLFINRLQNRYKYRDAGIDNNLMRNIKAYYYACVSFVDYQVGRILDALTQTGQRENTIIVFTSDHGEMLGDYNSFGKRGMHDSAAHIPFIVAGGDFHGGKQCESPVSLIDLAPTFLNIANTQLATHKPDGVDIAGFVNGGEGREGVYSFYSCRDDAAALGVCMPKEYEGNDDYATLAASCMMYVTQQAKYIYSAPDNKELYFDKKLDPHETRSKIGAPFYEDKVKEMRRSLIDMLSRTGHTSILEGDVFKRCEPLSLPDNPDSCLLVQDMDPIWADFSVLDAYGGRRI